MKPDPDDDAYVNYAVLSPLLFMLMVGSGYFGFEGFPLFRADDLDLGLAVVYAVMSSTVSFTLWSIALAVVPRLQTKRSIAAGILGVFGVGVFVFCSSTVLTVAGVAGDSALNAHVRATTRSFELALESRFQQAGAIRRLIPVLEQEQQLYLQRRESKIKFGAYSGVPGRPGAVEQTLGAIARQLGDLADDLRDEAARTAAAHARAASIMTRMRKAANGDESSSERLVELGNQGDALRQVLAEVNVKGQLFSVQWALSNLPGEVEIRATKSANKRTAARQQKALDRVRAELTQTTEKLASLADELGNLPVREIPVVEQINAIYAVMTYPLENSPAWAVAVSMDQTPGVIIFFLMVIRISRGRHGAAVDGIGSVSLRKAIQISQGIWTLARNSPDPDTIEALRRNSLGLRPMKREDHGDANDEERDDE